MPSHNKRIYQSDRHVQNHEAVKYSVNDRHHFEHKPPSSLGTLTFYLFKFVHILKRENNKQDPEDKHDDE